MSSVPVLDNILEQHFLSEFNDRWDRVIKPEETTDENKDENFDLILSLIDDLAPRGAGIVKKFCEPSFDEKPLMFWWVRRLLLEQILLSLDSLFANKRADSNLTDKEFMEESVWLLEKTRFLSLALREAEEAIARHQFIPTDIEEL